MSSIQVQTQLPITPQDVVGCRHRTVLTHAAAAGIVAPDRPIDYSSQVERYTHRLTILRRQAQVFALLPEKPRQGDVVRRLTRVDITNQDFVEDLSVEKTLEAMAEGTRLITNAHLSEGPLEVRVDLLVREDTGAGVDEFMRYIPVVFSGHAVAKKVANPDKANCRVLDVSALGLSKPVSAPWRRKNNPGDTQSVAMAHTILAAWGFASEDIGLVSASGDGAYRCFITSAEPMLAGLYAALKEPLPTQPVRIKECSTCDFHNHCRIQLLERMDVSLLLPGGKSTELRDEGIFDLMQLASDNKRGEQAQLAQAWMRGDVALRRPLQRWVNNTKLWGGRPFELAMVTPGFDGQLDWVDEVDVDMEAHPERGTFMWGTFDGTRYISFADFSGGVGQRGKAGGGQTGDGRVAGGGRRVGAGGAFSAGAGGGRRVGDEGRHVAEFWAWLMARKTAAEAEGKHFQAWVYAAQGENHWLRYYADHYGGREYVVSGQPGGADGGADGGQPGGARVPETMNSTAETTRVITMPTREEVDAFLASEHWCDAFIIVKKALAGTGSLGLKTVSPLAGFRFSQEGVDGRAAVALFEQSMSSSSSVALAARRTLERYNADDCYATRAVRHWLRKGAPGVPKLT